jgi:hypothetical protein
MSDCERFFLMIREKFILFQTLRIVHLILIKVHWIFVNIEQTISLVIDSWDFSIMTWSHYVILYWKSWAWTCSLWAFYIISSMISCLNWISQEIWNLQSLFAADWIVKRKLINFSACISFNAVFHLRSLLIYILTNSARSYIIIFVTQL